MSKKQKKDKKLKGKAHKRPEKSTASLMAPADQAQQIVDRLETWKDELSAHRDRLEEIVEEAKALEDCSDRARSAVESAVRSLQDAREALSELV